MKKFLVLVLTLCSFSVMGYGEITWGTPVSISTSGVTASDPHTVIDLNGNATGVWVENNVIMASSLPFGGSWSTPVAISNIANTASTPKLGIDSSGNVTALWIENTQIESATLPFGGSWTAEVSPISGTGASNPVLTVDASGNAVAAWVRSAFIESSTRPASSGTWSLVSVLSATNSSNPTVAISSFGTAIAGWHSVVSGSDVIVTNILTISSNTWGTKKNVFAGTATFFHNYPKIAMDSSGNASVAWIRYNIQDGNAYQNVQIISATLTEGASAWAVPTLLSNPGIGNPANLTIKLKYDLSGNTLAVWMNSYDGETYTLESAQKLFGGSWPSSIMLQDPSIYSLGFDVGVTSTASNALMTNMAWDGVSNLIIISQLTDMAQPVEQRWSFTTTISTGADNGFPVCAASVTGSAINTVSLWLNYNGTNVNINAATGSGVVIAPPTSVSATQSPIAFGVYTDYANTITWTASTDPTVIQYDIYRNGVFFFSVDPSTVTFTDHNQVQSGAVTYGIAALTETNGEFRQSQIVNFTLF